MADRRYIDENGERWDSKFEAEVCRELRLLEIPFRRCEKGKNDTIPYYSAIRGGLCLECKDHAVVQERTYTPDLCACKVSCPDHCWQHLIEIKGYWGASKRSLLRSVLKSNPDVNLLFIFQRDGKAGKSKYTEYVSRFLPTASSVVFGEPEFKAKIFAFLGIQEKSK